MKANAVVIHPRDNVAVVLEDISKGPPAVMPGSAGPVATIYSRRFP